MNSRERVLRAIHHQPADRVPIDLGGTRQSGIAASTYHRLKKMLGIDSPTRVYDVYQMLAEVERPIMERFGADVIGLNRRDVAFGILNQDFKPWTMFDGTPVQVPGGFQPVTEQDGSLVLLRDDQPIARMPKGGFYFDRVEKFPGAAHVDLDGYEPPRLNDQDMQHYRAQAEALYQNTDFAIVAPLGPPYELFYGLGTGDFEMWMITLASEPDYVSQLYEKLVDAWLDNLRRFVDAVGDRVQILQVNDDFGTQHSLFLSVDMYRRQIMPYYQRGLDWIHQNTNLKVLLHSDGAIFPLIPSLIETGFDILNPVQTSAAGMDPVRLKEACRGRLAFWGGSLDCQKTLPYGTVDQVQQEVQSHLEVFAPGGGYVFAPVHNIQAGVPPENVIAMYDTARRFSMQRLPR
ncbi:MAG: methyltransferase [Planctomycetaceae bacterium]|nr:MAG: methyltransferase [Planctomycetaceae bacterium]